MVWPQINDAYYVQTTGIPQGSVLSSLLCCVYLADIEHRSLWPRIEQYWALQGNEQQQKAAAPNPNTPGTSDQMDTKHTTPLPPPPSASNPQTSAAAESKRTATDAPARPIGEPYLLLRQIDDFLFISPSNRLVASFVQAMHSGFADTHGIVLNEHKTRVNFALTVPPRNHHLHSPLSAASQAEWTAVHDITRDAPFPALAPFIRWNGLLIHTQTLQVQADYTRLINQRMLLCAAAVCLRTDAVRGW